ncbi:hypothetical protein [Umezawaea sp. Da 62-37]|uniref:hypothetical protein n=1 Tax=Umezawaea sp. Da 62-37 TaxID=3075927 RepID=UPI0028F74221|nr:hypothetical protein [Umezawaea sp. Da 62-37]WNV91033.1 hypothetical protein RM788_22965 [Umezawaea sp. Da 62-37]
MAQQEPFASPYHLVVLPGQEQEHPPGWVSPLVTPMPVPESDVMEWRRPATLTASFWCWLAATALVVLGLPGIFALDHDVFARSLVDDARVAGEEPVSRAEAVFAAIATSGVFVIAFALPAIPFVIGFVNLRAGKEWARILLTALGGFGLLLGLVGLAVFANGVEYLKWAYGVTWAAAFVATTALAIVLMHLPSANTYVRGTTQS